MKLDYDPSGDNSFSGFDRFGRVREQLWSSYGDFWSEWGDTSEPDDFKYTYDREGNPTARTNELNHALDETYAYDPLNRLSSMTRGGAALQSWGLDALDNMSSVTTNGSPTQTRTPTSANEIQNISGGWITPAYDAAGNMISGPQPGSETTRVHYKYDAWNRLTAVYADDGSGHAGSLIAAYQYDGLNRRVKNTDANGWTHDYFYNQGGQMLEDRWTSAYEGIWSVDQYLWNPGYADSPMVCLHDGQDGYLGEPDGNVQDDYPTLMLHSDCDGEWTPEQCAELEKELRSIAAAFRDMPPLELNSGWQKEAAKLFGVRPANLYESFIDVDGELLIERLLTLCRLAQQRGQPILFQ